MYSGNLFFIHGESKQLLSALWVFYADFSLDKLSFCNNYFANWVFVIIVLPKKLKAKCNAHFAHYNSYFKGFFWQAFFIVKCSDFEA